DFLKSKHGKQRKNQIDVDSQYQLQNHSNPEKEFQQQELMAILNQVAEQLTPKQKAVFVLRDLEGLSTEEVSDVLSMSAGNVKSNLCHARQKVGERLKSFY